MATRAREVAQTRRPLQEQAGNPKLNQVQESMEQLNQWSGRDYEGEIPTTGPTPLTVEEWDDPTILDKATEVQAWRESQRCKPRRIPGLVREEDA